MSLLIEFLTIKIKCYILCYRPTSQRREYTSESTGR